MGVDYYCTVDSVVKEQWVSITECKPPDNAVCRVATIPALADRTGEYRFVRCSDGDYFWDNLIDEVLQRTEVTHWILP